MVNSEPNGLEGIGIKDGVEQAILLHSWTQTDECPECGCTSTLLIGPETTSEERLVEVVDCKTCDVVMQEIAGQINWNNAV